MAFVTEVTATNEDVVTAGKIGSSLFGICDTAANVAAKTVDIEGLDQLVHGLTIHVKFVNSNRAQSPTLTVDSVGRAIPLYIHGAVSPGKNNDRESWYAGSVLTLTYVYDSNNNTEAWEINDWQSDTTYGNASSSTAGLMSATDKANLDTVVNKRTTSLVFTNKSTSGWSNNDTYTNYKFRASITCSGITENHYAEVCFNPDDVMNYIPASVCQTYNGGVYVWTLVNPGRALTGITVFAVLPDRT